jgi:hypothetical protein
MAVPLLRLADPLIGKVIGGAVIGREGTIWTATPGFYCVREEMSEILAAFDKPARASCEGLWFLDEYYLISEITDDVMVAERIDHHLVVAILPRCAVIGFHDENIPFRTCYDAVLDLASKIRRIRYADLQ